jgi:hypothetical protein
VFSPADLAAGWTRISLQVPNAFDGHHDLPQELDGVNPTRPDKLMSSLSRDAQEEGRNGQGPMRGPGLHSPFSDDRIAQDTLSPRQGPLGHGLDKTEFLIAHKFTLDAPTPQGVQRRSEA